MKTILWIMIVFFVMEYQTAVTNKTGTVRETIIAKTYSDAHAIFVKKGGTGLKVWKIDWRGSVGNSTKKRIY